MSVASDQQSATRKSTPEWVIYAAYLSNIMMGIGRDFAYDFPQSLSPQLTHRMQIDTVKIGMLYSAYSLPNIFLAPFFGHFISKAGCGKVSVFCAVTMMFGHLLVYLAVEVNSYWLLVGGRCLFGIGGECCVILQ